MPRKISEIYAEYKIPQNLQEHMLRSAAVASLVCDNLNEPTDKKQIISACLLHDMGNIIKYDFSLPGSYGPEGIEYWKTVQGEYIKKYGTDEHKATVQIVRELNLSSEIVDLIDKVDFQKFCVHSGGNNFNIKIICYADSRVDPHGIVSYEERLADVRERYKDRKDLFPEEHREELIACGKEIEKQIFAKCKIKPADINDVSAAPIINELRNFSLH
jgi:hypothetical protein